MPRTIEILEHRTALISPDWLSETDGTMLLRAFGDRIDVQFPSPRTDGQWALTSRGYVGVLPLPSGATLLVRPKLPVQNIARMLQLAFDLPVSTFSSLAAHVGVQDLYEQLVRALLTRTRSLLRQGIHQRYRQREEHAAAVKGRIRVAEHLRSPARLRFPCTFAERTPDILENRVLLWTLDRVLRTGLIDDQLRQGVRGAHRELLCSTALVPIQPPSIDAIRYDRLTARYAEAHAICRLVLGAAGPVPEEGANRSVPFLLDMPRLFERFVARWLARSIGPEFYVRPQERVLVGATDQVEFVLDLVIYTSCGNPVCVLDTKYKVAGSPSAGDLAKTGYYALLKGCSLAGLVYPIRVPSEWEGASGSVTSFRTSFDLSGDLKESGHSFIEQLSRRLALLDHTSSSAAHPPDCVSDSPRSRYETST